MEDNIRSLRTVGADGSEKNCGAMDVACRFGVEGERLVSRPRFCAQTYVWRFVRARHVIGHVICLSVFRLDFGFLNQLHFFTKS